MNHYLKIIVTYGYNDVDTKTLLDRNGIFRIAMPGVAFFQRLIGWIPKKTWSCYCMSKCGGRMCWIRTNCFVHSCTRLLMI